MKRTLSSAIAIILFQTCFISTSLAGKHYTEPQTATIAGANLAKRILIVRNTPYKLRIGVKIHDSESKLPGLDLLKAGQRISFKTRKNKKTGLIEISEIWIIHQ